jgi:hypothetical protein
MKNIIKFYYNWKAKRLLTQKYLLDIAIEEYMKDWVTDCIISRKQEFRRKELVEAQNNISESQLFLKWLSKK